MSSILIAENIIESSHFLSATEQEGEHIGQPAPAAANEGEFRPTASGDVADFVYSGTATSGGSTTTIVDSVLAAFGDDYFIGATITFLTGENTSGTATITDFAQATGTLTWVGAVNSTLTADTFTMTLPYVSREFEVELVSAGDAGVATFKFSHDGGSTYFGRDDPYVATWLAKAEVVAEIDTAQYQPAICQAANGDVVFFYVDDAPQAMCKISSDSGITWGSPVTIHATATRNGDAVCLSSGRILITVTIAGDVEIYASDDNGATWASLTSGLDIGGNEENCLLELSNGVILFAHSAGGRLYVKSSTDEGANWSSAITILSDAFSHYSPKIEQASNGDIVCVYVTDEDDTGVSTDIKALISTDGGATWSSSSIDVIDNTSTATRTADILKDIDGTLYAIGSDNITGTVRMSRSTDNGATWTAASAIVLTTDLGGEQLQAASFSLIDGHTIICVYAGNNNKKIFQVRRGIWEAYSANGIPVAVDVIKQELACDISIEWRGGLGISGDDWSFEPEYDYSMKNLIADNPRRSWRSDQDNIAVGIVLDATANARFYADAVAFFGANIRSLNYQVHTTDSWAAPDTEEAVSFDITTAGVVDSVDGNMIEDAALLADYKDHELAGAFVYMVDGTDADEVFLIKDNVSDFIVLDTTATHNIAGADTFALFRGAVAKTFTEDIARYMRIEIASQETYAGYYEIGSMIAGKAVTLSQAWMPGYSIEVDFGIRMARSADGSMTPISVADKKRVWSLSWNGDNAVIDAITALVDQIRGKNIALIPDSTTMTDCYLVKMVGGISQRHWYSDKFNFSITLEEVV